LLVPHIQIPKPRLMGPWGGTGDMFHGIEGKSRRMESVTIRHSNIIRGISFSYVGEDGLTRTAGPWGNQFMLHYDDNIIVSLHAQLFCKLS
jgi:hypothetical protein